MTSFLGLEVEQDKGQIRLHLDTCVNEMLEDYKSYVKRDLKPKKIPMQPVVVLTKDNAPETPDPKVQKIYQSSVAKLKFVANWVRYDVSFAASQLARFCDLRVYHWASLHHVIGYLHSNPSFKPVYQRGTYNGLDGFADSDWAISELQQDCLHDTTNLSCCGEQECRRQFRCQVWKPNIIQHLKLQSRSYIFAT